MTPKMMTPQIAPNGFVSLNGSFEISTVLQLFEKQLTISVPLKTNYQLRQIESFESVAYDPTKLVPMGFCTLNNCPLSLHDAKYCENPNIPIPTQVNL